MKTILLNDAPFPVRGNLHDFLTVAAEKYPNEEFWIDAICIAQSNLQERNEQVEKMGSIYEGHRVLTWLGLKPHDENFDYLDFSTWESIRDEGLLKQDLLDTEFDFDLAGLSVCESLDDGALVRQDLATLCGIGGSDYWQRAWITQEQRLAANVILLCGHSEYNFSDIGACATRLSSQLGMLEYMAKVGIAAALPFASCGHALAGLPFCQFQKPKDYQTMINWETLSLDRTSEWPIYAKQVSLIRLVKEYNNLRCSQWQDKIYSLRGLAQEGIRIPVDYQTSRMAWFSHCLEAIRKPFCLCFVVDLVDVLELNHSCCYDELLYARKQLQTELRIEGAVAETVLEWWQRRAVSNRPTVSTARSHHEPQEQQDKTPEQSSIATIWLTDICGNLGMMNVPWLSFEDDLTVLARSTGLELGTVCQVQHDTSPYTDTSRSVSVTLRIPLNKAHRLYQKRSGNQVVYSYSNTVFVSLDTSVH